MINLKEVISLKIPFPNIDAELARVPHMYIYIEHFNDHAFVKSQTYKAQLRNKVKNFLVEEADISRNPYSHKTLIDLDKKFHIENRVDISPKLLTKARKDICDDLYRKVLDGTKSSQNQTMDTTLIYSLNSQYLKIIK